MRSASFIVVPLILFSVGPAQARDPLRGADGLRPTSSIAAPTTRADDNGMALSRSVANETTVLYTATFDQNGTCNAQGWTTADITAQIGDFFHVDDFAGLNPARFTPLAGTKSLWCGARPQATGPLCGYVVLPGYGNRWNQAFCTKACIPVSGDGLLDVSFLARFESEPGYDATSLEYTLDCSGEGGWTVIDGGVNVWDGYSGVLAVINESYDIGSAGPVKVRFHFQSDGAWSDEDGLWSTDGAFFADDLVVEGLPLEDFEDEAVGAIDATDWESCTPPGYGSALALFPGAAQLQRDPCARDLSCLWAALEGSTANYGCGGFPAQTAVPYGNADGEYLSNEIWSPDIPLTGSGASVLLEFSVYRDLPLDALIFYVWHVRTTDGSGCPGAWQDRSFVFYGPQKDWLRERNPVGDLLDLQNGVSMNVALGVVDMCSFWCGVFGSGACHSNAPLFDNVRVLRIDAVGPQWSIRDIDQFQDTFAADGTITGTARADVANDITPGANFGSIVPGDSATVTVSDPVNGVLSLDPGNGRAAVYLYAAVWPQGQPGKSGAALTQDPVRFPVVGTFTDVAGVEWTCLQLDTLSINGFPQPDRFCVDLNDNLFTPGDTVCFFYAATSPGGTSYRTNSNLSGTTDDIEIAATNASEFTVLPAGGYNRGGDILYVDGMDGRGAEVYWNTAFASMGLEDQVDRYDVRGPSSNVSNRPAGRVTNVGAQLIACYRKILWDTGDLSTGLGNGTGSPEKTDDYALVNAFLNGLANPGGVYIGGDDAAQELQQYQNAIIGPNGEGIEAITFRSFWMTHTLVTGSARETFGVNPIGQGVPGGCYTYDPSFVIYGGCPLINDFDVMQPTGTAVNEVTYGPGNATSNNGAVLGQRTHNGTTEVGVLFGGFSLCYIRDDDEIPMQDRANFLYDTLRWLGNSPPEPSPVGDPSRVNRLGQNYPNPFNPQTTIAFSLRTRGVASIRIYNVAGQLVRTLADETFEAGANRRVWDGRNDAGQPVSSGVYFYKLIANDFTDTRRMVLLK